MEKELIEITDYEDPRLDVYARLNETQLRHYYAPNGGLFIAESPRVTARALAAGCQPLSALVERSQAFGEAAEVLESLPDTAGTRRIAVLENVTNPTNVGAIIRSAAALGMEAVLLNHACSDPCYRRAARVSMGTVFQMPWTYLENTETGRGMHYVALLQSLGFKTAALALRKDTVSISDPCLAAEERLAVILGAEGEGLTDETIDRSDYTIRIPMAHGVDSLNVAACSAVAFWELSLYKGQPV